MVVVTKKDKENVKLMKEAQDVEVDDLESYRNTIREQFKEKVNIDLTFETK
jgi:hypothetical protein